jgi:hypothetical protein
MNRIHLISGPRNISTALMYSFGNREDITIVDEPMYAYYLSTHPYIDHPGKKEILESQSQSLDEVLSHVFFGAYNTEYLFIKNMAHHLDGVDWSFLCKLKNVFLIRSPQQLIASFAQVIPEPTILDIGIELEYQIFQYLKENGQKCIVLDSNEVLKHPNKVLSKLCSLLDISFDDNMLKWTSGPRDDDGIWAQYWYKNVHRSTGFAKQASSDRPFPERLSSLLKKAQEYYDLLYVHSIKA